MIIEHVAIIGGMCGFLGLALGLVSVAMVAGFTRSTHTVQYLPHDNTESFTPDKNLVEENDTALLSQVGRKNRPSVVEELDAPLDEITNTDFKF